jgi:hypothetical protein
MSERVAVELSGVLLLSALRVEGEVGRRRDRLGQLPRWIGNIF